MRRCIRISPTSCSTTRLRSNICGRSFPTCIRENKQVRTSLRTDKARGANNNLTLAQEGTMFDSDREVTNEGSTDPRRRVFLAGAVATIGTLALWQWRKRTILAAAHTASGEPGEVTGVLFSDASEH